MVTSSRGSSHPVPHKHDYVLKTLENGGSSRVEGTNLTREVPEHRYLELFHIWYVPAVDGRIFVSSSPQECRMRIPPETAGICMAKMKRSNGYMKILSAFLGVACSA